MADILAEVSEIFPSAVDDNEFTPNLPTCQLLIKYKWSDIDEGKREVTRLTAGQTKNFEIIDLQKETKDQILEDEIGWYCSYANATCCEYLNNVQ
jgi:hypothetical protein